MYKTINIMAAKINEFDDACGYCIHLPCGGDGQCGIYKDGECNFRRRYADQAEELIEKIRSELNENTD